MHYATRPDHHMSSCDPSSGVYIASGLSYVGRVREVDVTLAVEGMRCKSGVKFARRCNAIKVSSSLISSRPSFFLLAGRKSVFFYCKRKRLGRLGTRL